MSYDKPRRKSNGSLSDPAMKALYGCLVLGCCLFSFGFSRADTFEIEDTGAALLVKEKGNPVFVYNYKPVSPPPEASSFLPRSCYIHPLYGLDGDILTQDWPSDHFHHRGVFWAWPWCQVLRRRMDLWLSRDARQHFDRWLEQTIEKDSVVIGVQNSWRFDDEPDKTPVRETIHFTVHSADEVGRVIDVVIRLENLTDEPVILQGQQDSSKGYGGFCFRPDAKRAPLEFTSALGKQLEDAFELASPWVDVSSRIQPEGAYSGVAIFQHPQNPDYPHNGWLIRHYGFLGASWPHTRVYEIAPQQGLTLRYRLFVHRGNAEESKVHERFKVFEEAETK